MEDLRVLGEPKKKEAPKPLEVKIPDDVLKVMTELREQKNKLLQGYLDISYQAEQINRKKGEVYDKLNKNNEMYGQKIQFAFNKLKLKKKKQYRWGFNGKDAFIGQLVPEPPKKKI